MSTETKMGLGVIVVLVCAFGFLVYHKFDLKQQQLASIERRADSGESPDDSLNSVKLASSVVSAAALREGQPSDPHKDFQHTQFSFLMDDAPPPELESDTETSAQSDRILSESGEGPLFGTDAQSSNEIVQTTESDMESPLFDETDFPLESDKPEQTGSAEPPEFTAFTDAASDFNTGEPADRRALTPGDLQFDDNEDSEDIAAAQPADFRKDSDTNAFEILRNTADDRPAAGRLTDVSESDVSASSPDIDSDSEFPFFAQKEKDSDAETAIADAGVNGRDPAPARLFPDFEEAGDADRPADDDFESPQFENVTELEQDARPSVAGVEDRASISDRVDATLIGDATTPQSVSTTESRLDVATAESEASGQRELDEQPLLAFNDPATAEAAFPVPTGQFETDENDSAFDNRNRDIPPIGQIPSDSSPAGGVQSDALREFDRTFDDNRGSGGAREFADPGVQNPRPAPTQLEVDAHRAFSAPSARIQQVAAVSDECEICAVQPNDNYWKISKRMYGTARYFSSLALYNQSRIRDPRKLRPGMKVLIPDPKILEQRYPELFRDFQRKPRLPVGFFVRKDGSPAYRVGDRETLSEISQKHLGRASRWIQIYRLNQSILKDPNKLKPGIELLLPDDATNVHVAP